MTRQRYLTFFIPLVLLVIIVTDENHNLFPNAVTASICQVIVGFMAWAVIWFRLDFLKYRKEWAVITSLPFPLLAINGLYASAAHADMPFFRIVLGCVWISCAFVLGMTFVPDEHEPGTRRADTISVMGTVIMGYFCLFSAIQTFSPLIDKH